MMISRVSEMVFSRGAHTLKVPARLFAENRERLVAALKAKTSPGSFVLLQGGRDRARYNTDADDAAFRQESYFYWTFGCELPDCWGALDVHGGRSFLLPPKLDASFATWSGTVHPTSWFVEKYGVDVAEFLEAKSLESQLSAVLKGQGAKHVLLLEAPNTDSGETLEAPKVNLGIPTDKAILYPVIAELRVFKTDAELEVMEYACKMAVEAHIATMQHVKPGLYEYQLESLFRHTAYYRGGCRHCAYTCIGASGNNSSVLHYGHAGEPNARKIEDGDICLFDMGPEYACYGSDITTTFPANGKFTEKQKQIYEAVLAANLAVFEAARPGVRWTDMHLLSERVLLQALQKIGLVNGDIDAAQKARIGAVFQPHGLGHFLGLDVHDVGGYLGDALPRSTELGLKSLRTSRTLQERMVITIEPGCYFIDHLLNEALADPLRLPFLNPAKIEEFRGFGGVRIEDNVVVTATGVRDLCAGKIPRTVEAIEKCMAEGGKKN